MELIAAFVLGFVGSLHCAGMCGPLLLALPAAGGSRGRFVAGRLLYNAGRIGTYAVIGALCGLAGSTLSMAGLQRWVSLTIGATLLLGLIPFVPVPMNIASWKVVARLKGLFRNLLQERSLRSLFALGAVNGLLPCGLVYVAAAGSVATGSGPAAVGAMVAFGLGTLPMMLAIGLTGRWVQRLSPNRIRRVVPITIALLGTLLILRGLPLGIPYLSPGATATGDVHCPACAH